VLSRAGADDLRRLRLIFGRFVWPHLGLIALASFLGLLTATLTTVQPLVLAPIIDAATGGSEAPAASWRAITLNNVGSTVLAWTGLEASGRQVVAASGLVYVGIVSMTSLLGFAGLQLVSRARTRLFGDLQESTYRHLLGLSMSYFVRQRGGELVTRVNNDAFQVAQTVEPIIRGFMQASAQLVLSAMLLLRTDARLTTSILFIFLVHLAITRLLRRQIRQLVAGQVDLFGELAGRIHETLTSVRIVKSFGAERFEVGRFVDQAQRLGRVMRRGDVYRDLEGPLRDIVDAGGLMIVMLVAFSAFIDDRLSISGLVLFVALTRKALVPASWLAGIGLALQSTLGAAGRLLDLLNEKPEVVDGTLEAPALRERIRLEHVSFAYDGSPPVLRDISIEIRRGEVVALVGPSGAGKSTLADLILRLYDPTDGLITWDGVPLREFRQEGYRRRYGVVSQEALIFNSTVAENIAYGRPIERDAVAEAARAAHADHFIRALPGEYDAVVGDRGIRLSGGQRQRLAIARALYGDPDVLMLDEATSALDSESEAAVQEAIEIIGRRRTVLVIAHRLSTVIRADRILLLDEGRIQAVGTHARLLATSPLYERLCRHQLHDSCEALA
jgi:subfamily B ATP-binding cassette protein MsbA